MSITKVIGFIGGGNMAEAIVRGLLARKLVSPAQVLVSDPSANRRAFFETLGIEATSDNCDVVRRAQTVVLAVKPQYMDEALAACAQGLRPEQMVISIAAGIRTEKISSLCGGRASVIRVMPNTPALVGRGVSALCRGPRASQSQLQLAVNLFSAIGRTLVVEEKDMDAITAISGSGPAYIFYWMESMLKAATQAGFDAKTARDLVYGTFEGAVQLAEQSSETPDVLRARVTSKGGTTEAAIRTMNERGMDAAVAAAIEAATTRSRELSGT